MRTSCFFLAFLVTRFKHVSNAQRHGLQSYSSYADLPEGIQMDVGQNPVPPVNLKVDGHPLYHMISRFWPIPIYICIYTELHIIYIDKINHLESRKTWDMIIQ